MIINKSLFMIINKSLFMITLHCSKVITSQDVCL